MTGYKNIRSLLTIPPVSSSQPQNERFGTKLWNKGKWHKNNPITNVSSNKCILAGIEDKIRTSDQWNKKKHAQALKLLLHKLLGLPLPFLLLFLPPPPPSHPTLSQLFYHYCYYNHHNNHDYYKIKGKNDWYKRCIHRTYMCYLHPKPWTTGHSPVHQSPDTQVMDGVMGSCFLKDIVKGEKSVLTDNHLWHITHNGRAHLTQVNFLTDILWPNAGKIHKEHSQTCTKYGLSLVYQVIRNSCKKQVLNKIVECCKNCAFWQTALLMINN